MLPARIGLKHQHHALGILLRRLRKGGCHPRQVGRVARDVFAHCRLIALQIVIAADDVQRGEHHAGAFPAAVFDVGFVLAVGALMMKREFLAADTSWSDTAGSNAP